MKKLKLLPILGVAATAATIGSTLVACNKPKEPAIKELILDNWATDKLVLENVDLEPGKEYKVTVNTSKFEADFGTHPQLRLTNTEYDETIGCDVYYNGKQLSFSNPAEYICQNDGYDLVCFLAETITLEKGKDLYYIISIPNGAMDKTLYFENR
ncbi:MAG: hypothetical protein ACOQNV_01640 [Mycoplasmoidaceae bacterium]